MLAHGGGLYTHDMMVSSKVSSFEEVRELGVLLSITSSWVLYILAKATHSLSSIDEKKICCYRVQAQVFMTLISYVFTCFFFFYFLSSFASDSIFFLFFSLFLFEFFFMISLKSRIASCFVYRLLRRFACSFQFVFFFVYHSL